MHRMTFILAYIHKWKQYVARASHENLTNLSECNHTAETKHPEKLGLTIYSSTLYRLIHLVLLLFLNYYQLLLTARRKLVEHSQAAFKAFGSGRAAVHPKHSSKVEGTHAFRVQVSPPCLFHKIRATSVHLGADAQLVRDVAYTFCQT
jgi:hypothetical protein